MDLDTIDRLSFSGNALNAKERATLEVVMAKKSRDEPDLTEVLFWGKIQGTENSYLICVGLQDRFAGVPAKKFYYLYVNLRRHFAHVSLSLSLSLSRTYTHTHTHTFLLLDYCVISLIFSSIGFR